MKVLSVFHTECELALLQKGETQIQEQYLHGSMVSSKMETSIKTNPKMQNMHAYKRPRETI